MGQGPKSTPQPQSAASPGQTPGRMQRTRSMKGRMRLCFSGGALEDHNDAPRITVLPEVVQYMVHDDVMEEVQHCFSLEDHKGTGYISHEAAIKAMNMLGYNPCRVQMELLMKQHGIDPSKTGTINVIEFTVLWFHYAKRADEELHVLQAAFEALDDNKSGTISKAEFQRFMTEMGDPLSEEELALFFRLADRDGSGEINWAEFVKMMSMAMNAVNDMAHLVAMDPTEGGATGHVSEIASATASGVVEKPFVRRVAISGVVGPGHPPEAAKEGEAGYTRMDTRPYPPSPGVLRSQDLGSDVGRSMHRSDRGAETPLPFLAAGRGGMSKRQLANVACTALRSARIALKELDDARALAAALQVENERLRGGTLGPSSHHAPSSAAPSSHASHGAASTAGPGAHARAGGHRRDVEGETSRGFSLDDLAVMSRAATEVQRVWRGRVARRRLEAYCRAVLASDAAEAADVRLDLADTQRRAEGAAGLPGGAGVATGSAAEVMAALRQARADRDDAEKRAAALQEEVRELKLRLEGLQHANQGLAHTSQLKHELEVQRGMIRGATDDVDSVVQEQVPLGGTGVLNSIEPPRASHYSMPRVLNALNFL